MPIDNISSKDKWDRMGGESRDQIGLEGIQRCIVIQQKTMDIPRIGHERPIEIRINTPIYEVLSKDCHPCLID
jgi:hypothetical protein